METVIVRLELSPECAAAVERVLEQALVSADSQLGQDPPQHTRRALTTMREHIDHAARELARAAANPLAVEVEHFPKEGLDGPIHDDPADAGQG